MKILVIIGFLVFTVYGAFAQNEALDSNCYRPEMGNPNELDTIYGSQAYQHLGDGLRVLPPLKGQVYDRLVMKGLPGNIPFLTAVETGPTFDLHKLKTSKKYPYIFEYWSVFKTGHFRSPKYTDILAYHPSYPAHPIIYWADENGEYDSSRYTQIFPFNDSVKYTFVTGRVAPYIGRFISDTVDDIILSVDFQDDAYRDSTYIALVRGGQQLYDKGKIAMWDELEYWELGTGSQEDIRHRTSIQGDWRGVGREDLVSIDDWCNFYYYRNDAPFSLKRFVESLRNDTLIKANDWSLYKELFNYYPSKYSQNILAMKAFPKQSWDKSVDLLIPLPIGTSSDVFNNNGICIFKGGPEFGSKRLSFDSSDFFLHCPGYYSSTFANVNWPFIGNGGDLTGTGNPVLMTSGGGGIGYSFLAFYVLGKALDDKIDVFWSLHYGGGSSDTIIATSKLNTTFVGGSPAYMTPEDQEKGVFEKGMIEILYGAEKIPVRLNPMYSMKVNPVMGFPIETYPNPTTRSLNAVVSFDHLQPITIILRDALGRAVYNDRRYASGGSETLHIELPKLSSGIYVLQIEGELTKFSSKVTIIN